VSGQKLLWDDLVSGFGTRFTPTKTTFVVQWRDPATGKKPRESLRPAWPRLSTAQARDAARKRLGEVVAVRGTAGGEPLRVGIRRWYELQTERNAWRPRYRTKVDQLIATYIEGIDNPRVKLKASARQAIADLGTRPVAAVSRSDVLRVADAIKPGAADQFMAQVSAFYNWVLDRGVEVPNPARNRLRVTGGRRLRHRALSDAEFLKLYRVAAADGDPCAAAFLLLALTGMRRREATQLRWSEVDLAAGTITLPPERRKTGGRDPHPFVINLHPLAVEAIQRQPKLEGSPFVFWGRRDRRPWDFHSATLQRLNGAGVSDWRIHDLRRYMRSGLSRLGVQQVVAELCLGHIAKTTLVAVYDQHTYQQERRDAWIRWGDHIQQLVGQQRP
jgi:integrase